MLARNIYKYWYPQLKSKKIKDDPLGPQHRDQIFYLGAPEMDLKPWKIPRREIEAEKQKMEKAHDFRPRPTGHQRHQRLGSGSAPHRLLSASAPLHAFTCGCLETAGTQQNLHGSASVTDAPQSTLMMASSGLDNVQGPRVSLRSCHQPSVFSLPGELVSEARFAPKVRSYK